MGDDMVMVSRSKLTRDFATILFESNNGMHELMSTVRRALEEAEEDFKHSANCQQNRLQECLDEAAKRQAPRPDGASSVITPLQFDLLQSEDTPVEFTMPRGQTSPLSCKSDVSSTGRMKRHTVRMQYDGMNKLTARFG